MHLGDGLRLRPLWLCCSLWVSVLLPVIIQMWCVCCCFVFGKLGLFSVTGVWTTNAPCILCLWTRMRTWLPRRSQWPCTQTTCLPVASPTRICRCDHSPHASHSKMLREIVVVCFMFYYFNRHFRLLQTWLPFYSSLFLSHY